MIKVSKQDIGRKVIRAFPEDATEDGKTFLIFNAGTIVGFNDSFIYVHFAGTKPEEYSACVAPWLHWPDQCKIAEAKLHLEDVRHG